jgi:hypothetical protein
MKDLNIRSSSGLDGCIFDLSLIVKANLILRVANHSGTGDEKIIFDTYSIYDFGHEYFAGSEHLIPLYLPAKPNLYFPSVPGRARAIASDAMQSEHALGTAFLCSGSYEEV